MTSQAASGITRLKCSRPLLYTGHGRQRSGGSAAGRAKRDTDSNHDNDRYEDANPEAQQVQALLRPRREVIEAVDTLLPQEVNRPCRRLSPPRTGTEPKPT